LNANPRSVLIALFALFLAPIIVAVLLNSRWLDWSAEPTRAHGRLVEPVRALGEMNLTDASGRERSRADWTGSWQLVHVAGPGCARQCAETAALMDNIRLSLDRHFDEVGLVLATPTESAGRELTDAVDSDHWMVFSGTAAQDLLQRFPDPMPGSYYIVDPEANIMERFAPGSAPTGIRKDLDRLVTWTVRE